MHRDLKPSNVTLRPDGTVKVLDFGLAKLATADAASSAALSMSPTITSPAMTQAGLILGTAAYMSPEQARGRPADKRADIWAFGVVLYEMLAGRRLFEAETISDTIAAVLTREPDMAALPAGVPPAVRALLRRCLDRDPMKRLRDIGEARLVLSGATAGLVAGGATVWYITARRQASPPPRARVVCRRVPALPPHARRREPARAGGDR